MAKAPKERGHISEDILRQLASCPNGSLFYEALMLNEAANKCTQLTCERSLSAYVQHMAIESFLIHFRNLRDFLYPDAKVLNESDNVIASDYEAHWLKTNKHWTPCSGDERNRINKRLAHIAYSRESLDPHWPIPAMRRCMMQSLKEFILSLPAERQKWFEGWGLKDPTAAAGCSTRAGFGSLD